MLGIQISLKIYICIFKVGVWIRKPLTIWCDHHLPLQWLCKVAGSWRELQHTVVHGSFQSILNMLNVWCTQVMELGHVQLLRIVYRSLCHGECHYHAETWGDRWWMNVTTMGLRISSRYLCAFRLPSIKCNCANWDGPTWICQIKIACVLFPDLSPLTPEAQLIQYDEEPRRKPIMYEDLRNKNRETYEVTLTQKAETLLKPESDRQGRTAHKKDGESVVVCQMAPYPLCSALL